MKVYIQKELFEKLPEIKVAFLIVHDINIDQKNDEMQQKLETSINQCIEKYKDSDISTLPDIKKWHGYAEKLGIDTKKVPISSEAMINRILAGKEIRSINPLVDFYNSLSIDEIMPMGAYDLDNTEGDIYLGIAKGGEKYKPLSGKEDEEAEKGEVIFADQNEVMCRHWVYKQSATQKVELHSRNLIFRIEGVAKTDEEFEHTLNLLEKELYEYFHPEKIEIHKLDKENTSCEFEKPKLDEKEQLIQRILNRGVADVIVKENLARKLRSGKKLRIKLGIDPTGADLHIGHMVVIKKLKEFQDLGHHIQLLFGNFTGQLGDPTGKIETRKSKTQTELEENAKHYIAQAGKILDTDKIEVVWNADWLAKLSFGDVTKLAATFTVAQMLDRDMFQDRIKSNLPIGVHEFMYPLMQGYDSVALESDVELGGTDQTFNLLAGRQIQEAYGQEPQNILTVPILEGLDGHIKMGKSTNNYIGVNEDPKEMYGKTMSIPDSLILRYFELATDLELGEIAKIKAELEGGANPRDLKMRLAREIVTYYHGIKEANAAEDAFISQFREGSTPDDIPEFKITDLKGETNIIEILVKTELVNSKSEARRGIEGGGVKIDGEKVENIEQNIEAKEGMIIQVGKRRFVKLI